MHHFKNRQREIINEFEKNTRSKFILVKPNPFNPLIFLQIQIHPDMSLSEEIEYLQLTPRKLRKEFKKAGVHLTSYKQICLLPPFILNIVLRKVPRPVLKLSMILPFISSYQLIIGEVAY